MVFKTILHRTNQKFKEKIVPLLGARAHQSWLTLCRTLHSNEPGLCSVPRASSRPRPAAEVLSFSFPTYGLHSSSPAGLYSKQTPTNSKFRPYIPSSILRRKQPWNGIAEKAKLQLYSPPCTTQMQKKNANSIKTVWAMHQSQTFF